MYQGQPYSHQERAYAPSPLPVSGLEAAISTAIAAVALPTDSQRHYAIHNYEVRKQEAYVMNQTFQFNQPYASTSSFAFPEVGSGSQQGIIYHSQPISFLSPSRPRVPFVGGAAEIADFVKEAFLKTTGQELPGDIIITVALRSILQHIHRQFFNNSVVGLSLNGSREVFAVAGTLDEVMLVIGHELGHVISPALQDGRAEEAKAFAFEMAWAMSVFEHDIAGLRMSINAAALAMKPAQNGLHDSAFAFVKSQTDSGKEPLQLHSQIVWNNGIDFNDEAVIAAQTSSSSYVPLISSTHSAYVSGGYRNKSNVQNVPWMNNFSWADLGTGVYGMYIPMTASIFMNERLLRNDLEQFHKTLGHEYILHHVMQLPDNYVTKILEDTIFWVKDEKDKYKP